MELDSSLFADAADVLGVAYPAIVEKDYYAVQLIKLLSAVKTKEYEIVFSGGTCLSKVHFNTYRMSEDVDIKIVPTEETKNETKSRQKNLRKTVHQKIVDEIEASNLLIANKEPIKQNENRFFQIHLEYPKHHREVSALRPYLQLEVTESELMQEPLLRSISSLYAEVTNQQPEVSAFKCIDLETTAAEKLVALLRRIAAFSRDNSRKNDPTLIRHMYDLCLIDDADLDIDLVNRLVPKVIETDQKDFGKQHREFSVDPVNELRYGFDQLKSDPKYKQNYEEFIGPLVYHKTPPDWNTCMAAAEKFVSVCLA